MGWSCGRRASEVLGKWQEFCYRQTQRSNVFVARSGKMYFFEISRTEHRDGAITGTIWRYLDKDMCRKTSSFRIEGNGEVTTAPKCLKEVSPSQQKLDEMEAEIKAEIDRQRGSNNEITL